MHATIYFVIFATLHLGASPSLLRQEKLHEAGTNTTSTSQRDLIATDCKGKKLGRFETLSAGESICARINDEMVYFGVTSEAMSSGYIMTNIRLWSEFGTYNRNLRGFGIRGKSPNLTLQDDANLVMYGNTLTGGCRAKPDARGPGIELEMGGPAILTIRDDDGVIVWRYGTSSCYPDEVEPSCVPVLRSKERLSWNEYVCDYDSDGCLVSRFGLDKSGLLGLWDEQSLSLRADWQPRPGHLRGDYLHLQDDGHLTLYNQKERSDLQYIWTSKCVSESGTKITVSDHDMHQFRSDGSVTWALTASDEGTNWLERCFVKEH